MLKPTLFLLCLAQTLCAQDYTSLGDAPKKALNAYEDGVYQVREKAWDKAETAFLKAIKIAPNFIDAHWQLGELYYTQKSLAKAEQCYQATVRLSPNYKPQTLFTLGLIHEQAKNWAQAADDYDAFLQLKRDPELIKKAIFQTAYCRFRALAYANPVPFIPKNLGENINSKHDEYLPSLSIDGKTLIFTVHIDNKNEEFFIAKNEKPQGKDGNWWKKAENMGAPLNTLRNEGAQTIAADGKTIVFSACDREDGVGRCDFYISDYINGVWTEPKNMGEPINTKYWDGHSSLSADGKTLYLSSNRKAVGAQGDDDIFVATRNDDGSWNTPVALPANINTPYGDRSPFIHADGRTLYFSSYGHAGMGKSDIFRTQKNENGTWQKPINLGFPINTADADWSLIVAPDGKTAYCSTKREGGQGGMDLYSFELPEAVRAIPTTFVRGIVKDFETQQIITGANCILVDLTTQKIVTRLKTDGNGSFLLPLPTGKRYSVTIQHATYSFYSDNFELQGVFSADKPFEKMVFLQKIKTTDIANLPTKKDLPKGENTTPSKAIVLKNIFFNTNSSDLLPASDYELWQLLNLLNENPNLNIQINGHTDNQGGAAQNQTLSEKRANAVMQFLITNGISKTRLRAKGFGESQPIDGNDTPDGRANNRRTEFFIL
jgi:outer membrane protein OmpA-like peptidoglycan-associated protein